MTTYTSVFGNDTIPPSGKTFASVTLTADTVFYWPEQATTTNLIADLMEVTCAAPYTLTLPPTNIVSTGREVLIRNTGAQTVTIVNSAAEVVTTLSAGEVKYLYVKDNGTAAGTWGVFTFGAGTSAADASVLSGYGLKVTGGTLSQDSVVRSAVGNVTVTIDDRAALLISINSGAVTYDLPAATTATSGFFFSVANQGTGAITINPSSTELIDGELTKELAPGESATIVCNGNAWYSVGYGRSTQFQFTKLVLDISTGSPFTLTSAQAQNKLLQFIGTATENIVVNVPAVVAVYYVQNSYAGAFTLEVKTAAGFGVTLSNNDRAILYCDGTNVVSAQTADVPASNLANGVAGQIPYQIGSNVTGFSATGTSGDFFLSGGTGAPTWVSRVNAIGPALQEQTGIWCGTAGGTNNALTLAPSPAITAYVAGQSFTAVVGGISSDGPATLAVSGLAAKSIQIDGAALSATVKLVAGKIYRFDYDGTQFQATRLSVAMTAAGLALLDDVDAAAQRTTLGLSTAATADVGLAAGNIQQVDQPYATVVRAATTVLAGSLNCKISSTGANITAFNGTAGVTYNVKFSAGGGTIFYSAGLNILQTGANITTAAGDTARVRMLTGTTCELFDYQRASGQALVLSETEDDGISSSDFVYYTDVISGLVKKIRAVTFYVKMSLAGKAIFGYGYNGTAVSMTNLVSNTGVVATDTTGVGTARYGLAAAGYGGDKAIFGYGYSTAVVSLTNLVSNTGVVSADTTGVGTARYYLAAAGYGGDKAIFGYGFNGTAAVSLTNLVSNTGVVSTDTTGVGTARYILAAAGYGGDKAIFGYGSNTFINVSLTNLVSNTGVVSTDTTGVGTARNSLAAAGYGGDKAIFGYGYNGTASLSITNLVSNTGVVATDTAGVGTVRHSLAAAGYGVDKAIFGYGANITAPVSLTNLVSNIGIVATDTAGVGTARWGLAAAGYGG